MIQCFRVIRRLHSPVSSYFSSGLPIPVNTMSKIKINMQKHLFFYKTVTLVITLMTFSGCVIGKRSVFVDKMWEKPILTINQDTLIVKTSLTSTGSAICTYEINILVDESEKKVYLSAYEALVRTNSRDILTILLYPFTRPCKFVFHIKLSKYKVYEPNSFEYYWRDPDKKITKLEITP